MASRKRNHVRIIGGRWKNTRISLAGNSPVRPTPVRARQVLFNWLNFDIAGMKALDLFAGSGVLGFEALSRGAANVVFIDNNQAVCSRLRANCHELSLAASQASVIHTDALKWLQQHEQGDWDLVFLDPPFDRLDWYPRCLQLLKPRISSESLVYIENSRRHPPQLTGYDVWKSKQIGEVQMALLYPAKESHDLCSDSGETSAS